jgi:hypothetical protein
MESVLKVIQALEKGTGGEYVLLENIENGMSRLLQEKRRNKWTLDKGLTHSCASHAKI